MNASIACSRTGELRKGTRYSLKMTALFDWAPQVGEPQCGRGVTRDINNSGVYVRTDELPQLGASVQLDIVIPGRPGSYLGMHLLGDGVVTRVEYRGITQGGFAASMHFFVQEEE